MQNVLFIYIETGNYDLSCSTRVSNPLSPPNKQPTFSRLIFNMDSASINQVFNELYIPGSPKDEPKKVPAVAPSLIMQDKTTDATHHLSCGCLGAACIHQNAWWSDKEEPIRPSLAPLRSSSAVSTISNP